MAVDQAARPASDSTVARLVADRTTAERVFALLSETLDPEHHACAVFENPANTWTVAVHSRELADPAALRRLVEAAAGSEAAAALRFETVAATDWVAASLAGLPPVTAGRFIVHGAHDRGRVPVTRIGIEVEAALAFGTGHHGTTRGCLLAFDRLLKAHRPQRVLDVGTGTGVLAIAAARALRRRVVATDIDAQAVTTAAANMQLNRAASWVTTVHAVGVTAPGVRDRGRYDLVFANILLGPLQRLARPIAGVLAPRARIILSGLLPDHANAARAIYAAQGLQLEQRLDVDGWTTLVMRRGPKSP